MYRIGGQKGGWSKSRPPDLDTLLRCGAGRERAMVAPRVGEGEIIGDTNAL
jgi:hypothetical protein